MPGEDPRKRRSRFTLTGLEGAEELWGRLRESAEEVERLHAQSATLAAEVDGLRKRLRSAGELSDDEVAAGLPLRMSRNLAAAQDVADDMIDRARNDAMITRLNADQTAAQLLGDAEAEATRIVQATVAKCRIQVEATAGEGQRDAARRPCPPEPVAGRVGRAIVADRAREPAPPRLSDPSRAGIRAGGEGIGRCTGGSVGRRRVSRVEGGRSLGAAAGIRGFRRPPRSGGGPHGDRTLLR